MDHLAARCYYYHSRAYEINEKLEEIRGFVIPSFFYHCLIVTQKNE